MLDEPRNSTLGSSSALRLLNEALKVLQGRSSAAQQLLERQRARNWKSTVPTPPLDVAVVSSDTDAEALCMLILRLAGLLRVGLQPGESFLHCFAATSKYIPHSPEIHDVIESAIAAKETDVSTDLQRLFALPAPGVLECIATLYANGSDQCTRAEPAGPAAPGGAANACITAISPRSSAPASPERQPCAELEANVSASSSPPPLGSSRGEKPLSETETPRESMLVNFFRGLSWGSQTAGAGSACNAASGVSDAGSGASSQPRASAIPATGSPVVHASEAGPGGEGAASRQFWHHREILYLILSLSAPGSLMRTVERCFRQTGVVQSFYYADAPFLSAPFIFNELRPLLLRLARIPMVIDDNPEWALRAILNVRFVAAAAPVPATEHAARDACPSTPRLAVRPRERRRLALLEASGLDAGMEQKSTVADARGLARRMRRRVSIPAGAVDALTCLAADEGGSDDSPHFGDARTGVTVEEVADGESRSAPVEAGGVDAALSVSGPQSRRSVPRVTATAAGPRAHDAVAVVVEVKKKKRSKTLRDASVQTMSAEEVHRETQVRKYDVGVQCDVPVRSVGTMTPSQWLGRTADWGSAAPAAESVHSLSTLREWELDLHRREAEVKRLERQLAEQLAPSEREGSCGSHGAVDPSPGHPAERDTHGMSPASRYRMFPKRFADSSDARSDEGSGRSTSRGGVVRTQAEARHNPAGQRRSPHRHSCAREEVRSNRGSSKPYSAVQRDGDCEWNQSFTLIPTDIILTDIAAATDIVSRGAEQGWRCFDCGLPVDETLIPEGRGAGIINAIRSKVASAANPDRVPRLCHYTGRVYCGVCMPRDSLLSVIPARLLATWDASLYPVSELAFRFLQSMADDPVLSLALLGGPAIEEASRLRAAHGLRQQVQILALIMSDCASVPRRLQELLHDWSRFLFVSLTLEDETYSFNELLQMNDEVLQRQTQFEQYLSDTGLPRPRRQPHGLHRTGHPPTWWASVTMSQDGAEEDGSDVECERDCSIADLPCRDGTVDGDAYGTAVGASVERSGETHAMTPSGTLSVASGAASAGRASRPLRRRGGADATRYPHYFGSSIFTAPATDLLRQLKHLRDELIIHCVRKCGHCKARSRASCALCSDTAPLLLPDVDRCWCCKECLAVYHNACFDEHEMCVVPHTPGANVVAMREW